MTGDSRAFDLIYDLPIRMESVDNLRVENHVFHGLVSQDRIEIHLAPSRKKIHK